MENNAKNREKIQSLENYIQSLTSIIMEYEED